MESESIKQISHQFFEMVPVRKMKWRDEDASHLASSVELQRQILQATVLHPLCSKYPPALSYMIYFMKLLVQKLEWADAEICDEMYETYTSLMSRHDDDEDSLCYKTYSWDGNERISLQESVNLVSQGTTGLSTWQAAQHLAEWIIENKELFDSKSVLELGSGQGLAGLVACKTCQIRQFTFSDCHSQVLYLLSRNIEQNVLSKPETEESSDSNRDRKNLQKIREQLSLSSDSTLDEICVEINDFSNARDLSRSGDTSLPERQNSVRSRADRSSWDLEKVDEICADLIELEVNPDVWKIDGSQRWADLRDDSRIRLAHLDWECVKTKFLDWLSSDIVLAADVVYDTNIVPSLVYVLKKLLRPKGGSNNKPVAYVASAIRNEETRDAFFMTLGMEGLSFNHVEPPGRKLFHYDRSVPIEILKITSP